MVIDVDGYSSRLQPGANDLRSGESDFQDSSRALFSMYLTIAEEEDDKTTDRWQKDADVILIFVSSCFAIPANTS